MKAPFPKKILQISFCNQCSHLQTQTLNLNTQTASLKFVIIPVYKELLKLLSYSWFSTFA